MLAHLGHFTALSEPLRASPLIDWWLWTMIADLVADIPLSFWALLVGAFVALIVWGAD